MKSSHHRTVLIRVKFSDRTLAKSALEELGRSPALLVHILRGRITQENASFELEVAGPSQRIHEFIQQSDRWEASIGVTSVGAA